jgi:hypothetical protein
MSAPAVAVSQDGKRFAAAWKDVRKGSPRVWWAFGADPTFAKDAPVDEPKVERNHPSLAVEADGTFWVAWEEGRDAQARVRARSSAKDGKPRDVADAAQGVPAYPVTACGAGLVVVAWETTGAGEGIFARVLEDRGR